MKRAAVLFAAAWVSFALGLPSVAAAEPSPWWQVLSGSRPANLTAAPDQSQVQRVSTSKAQFGAEEIFVARVEVGGEVVGCLGTGEVLGVFDADFLCEQTVGPGVAVAENGAEFREMLQAGPYGDGEFDLSGGPIGGAPFLITTPGRWVPAVQVTPTAYAFPGAPGPVALGSASSEVTSEGSGRLTIIATNLGDAPLDATESPLTLTAELPEGLQPYRTEAFAGGQGSAGPVSCAIEVAEEPEDPEEPKGPDRVECDFDGELPSYEAIELDILIALKTGASPTEMDISVHGANAEGVEAAEPIEVSDQPVSFGFERFTAGAEEEGGKPTDQAGAHPFQVTNTVQFNSGAQSGANRLPGPDSVRVEQPALPRNTRVTFPAGLAGSAIAVDQCEAADFITTLTEPSLHNLCPPSSAVGVASVTIIESAAFGLARLAVPVFNLTPAYGQPARFGFMPAGVPVIIDTAVDPADGYRIVGEVRNAPQAAQVLSATITLWGTPGDETHDASRGWECVLYTWPAGGCTPEEGQAVPFLRMPTRCGQPLPFEAELEPWNVPAGSAVARARDEAPPLEGCNRVPFDPKISSTLTTRAAESPTGLEFELTLPGRGFDNPEAEAAEAQPKRVEVTLPEGVTVNPSQAEGLATCSEARLARERSNSRPGEGCPEASKIGSIEGTTPLISETLRGSLYIAEPYANPFDTLIALYIVARVPERGVLIKQAGVVEPDPRTGQLISTFDDLPQLPYDNFKLRFREGGRAPLVSPPACGSHETTARFVPWSAHDPDDPDQSEVAKRSDSFEIERGVGGGPCPAGGVPPFNPGFQAGSLNNQAGAFSPFHLRLTRRDGDQDMTRFSTVLPPGMVGSLAGVPWCPETGIARAQSRSGDDGGREELADPSCPAASRIGSTLAGAGVGSVLTYVPGSLYLAGPHKGAPLSVVAVTPAVAGPFDAGVVVVRVGLTLNPVTAEVEVDGAASDPIPHILKGIPLKLRDLRVAVDRPRFTLNPTSCAEMETRATLFGSYLDLLSPADDVPVGLAARFQAAGCRGLGFKPRLGLKLKGKPRRGGFPALRAHYRPRSGDANLKRLALALPSSAFIEQGHFRTICTRVQFAAGPGHGALCPKGSIYGRARVWSPLLDEPLTGPVYLRSSDNNLPDAVFALTGPPSAAVQIEVVVRIDSVKGRLRATVESAPDAPVSRALVDMQGGRKGLIVNSRHLCHKPGSNRARANLRAQSGHKRTLKPVARARACAKKRKAKRARFSGARVVRAEPGGGR